MSSASGNPAGPLSRDHLLEFFLRGAAPRERWRVGMELEKMGREARSGRPIPYDGSGPTVRKVIERLMASRGGEPVNERGLPIGISAPWGTISIEPGGQVEWSSSPRPTLADLERDLEAHLAALGQAARALGITWLDVAVDPELSVADMPWMPKARYDIMRNVLGRQGRLAHRMMTQTASIQCAFDFADATDWSRKFRAAAALAPVATALFANSSRIDGTDTGHVSYRQAIWRETDPDRCGLPPVVFERGFGLERWVDYLLDVPMLFYRRDGGLVPSRGESFAARMREAGGELGIDDWATHVSTIFTEVRSNSYLEVRCADLQPDGRAMDVPTFWTGTLYDEDALEAALEIGGELDHAGWERAMASAARDGFDGTIGRHKIREAAEHAVVAALRAIAGGAPCTDGPAATRRMESLASRVGLDAKV